MLPILTLCNYTGLNLSTFNFLQERWFAPKDIDLVLRSLVIEGLYRVPDFELMTFQPEKFPSEHIFESMNILPKVFQGPGMPTPWKEGSLNSSFRPNIIEQNCV